VPPAPRPVARSIPPRWLRHTKCRVADRFGGPGRPPPSRAAVAAREPGRRSPVRPVRRCSARCSPPTTCEASPLAPPRSTDATLGRDRTVGLDADPARGWGEPARRCFPEASVGASVSASISARSSSRCASMDWTSCSIDVIASDRTMLIRAVPRGDLPRVASAARRASEFSAASLNAAARHPSPPGEINPPPPSLIGSAQAERLVIAPWREAVESVEGHAPRLPPRVLPTNLNGGCGT
jgi:hypothetical protein